MLRHSCHSWSREASKQRSPRKGKTRLTLIPCRLLVAAALGVLCLGSALLFLPACSATQTVVNSEHSPKLLSSTIESYNQGSESAQYLKLNLAFDRPVALTNGYAPEVRLAGAVVEKERIEVVAESEETLAVRIAVDRVQEGDLTLRLAPEGETAVPGIADEAGDYAAQNSTVHALVPSGLALSEAKENRVEVVQCFAIRGVAWILLYEGDELVENSLLGGADTLDGAIALHGHDFLTDDAYDIAANLAETLANHFGDRYEFTAEGTGITARSLTNPNAEVRIRLFEYLLVE